MKIPRSQFTLFGNATAVVTRSDTTYTPSGPVQTGESVVVEGGVDVQEDNGTLRRVITLGVDADAALYFFQTIEAVRTGDQVEVVQPQQTRIGTVAEVDYSVDMVMVEWV